MFTILLLFLYHTSVLASVSVRKHRQEDAERYGVPDLRTTMRPIQANPTFQTGPTWVARPTQESIPIWVEETDEGADEESEEEYEEPKRMVLLVQNPPFSPPPSYPIPRPLPPVFFHAPTVQYFPLFPYCCQSNLPLLPYY